MTRPDTTVIALVGGLLPAECRIVGLSLDELDDDGFRDLAHDALAEHARAELTDTRWAGFAALLRFARAQGAKDYAAMIGAAERDLGGCSTSPSRRRRPARSWRRSGRPAWPTATACA